MQWVGWLVIGFVCFWMAIIAFFVLRTGLFMLTLTWAGLKQWREYRAKDLDGPAGRRAVKDEEPVP